MAFVFYGITKNRIDLELGSCTFTPKMIFLYNENQEPNTQKE